jgi:cytochrome c553
MIIKLLTASLSLTLICLSGNLLAETNTGKAKTAVCAGCHGEDGNSQMPSFPKLAGQHKGYLVKQLHGFKSGARISPMMAPMAIGLDDQTIQEVAEYYANHKISPNPTPVLPVNDDDDDATAKSEEQKKVELDKLIAQGGDLYRNGNLTTAVSACIACHGPFGEGNRPASFPSLHSQHAEYVIKTLSDFKSGARTKSRDNVMVMIATKMTDLEIKAVATYISTMR